MTMPKAAMNEYDGPQLGKDEIGGSRQIAAM